MTSDWEVFLIEQVSIESSVSDPCPLGPTENKHQSPESMNQQIFNLCSSLNCSTKLPLPRIAPNLKNLQTQQQTMFLILAQTTERNVDDLNFVQPQKLFKADEHEKEIKDLLKSQQTKTNEKAAKGGSKSIKNNVAIAKKKTYGMNKLRPHLLKRCKNVNCPAGQHYETIEEAQKKFDSFKILSKSSTKCLCNSHVRYFYDGTWRSSAAVSTRIKNENKRIQRTL